MAGMTERKVQAHMYGNSTSALDVRGLLASLTPFRIYGHMYGTNETAPSTGRLPQEWSAVYRRDAGKIAFTVVSWATPIAWVVQDGTVVVPDVSYSQSTRQHQDLCRKWLARDIQPCRKGEIVTEVTA